MNKHITAAELIDMLREENRQLKERIAKLEGGDDAARAIRVFKMTRKQAVAFSMLLNHDVDRWDIFNAAYDGETSLENPEWAINTLIKRMRKCIRPRGIDIESVYGFGYRMTDDNRRRARELLRAS